MPRIFPIGAYFVLTLALPFGIFGQSADRSPTDHRLDDAVAEIAALKRTVAEQDRRIAGLERTVRNLQAPVAIAPTAMGWKTPAAWAAVKIGMSRAQVEDILGAPTTAEAVIDRQTLSYKDTDAEAVGVVLLVDDRVSQVDSARFRIHTLPQK